ncbi:hypothetical protein CTEN210_14123 [Chaetoceros tenuissimus]|uniref:SET domain-containing protein n=1 Tax=Chaetoceros tenuissimus TaxID=426638 RepID=A0AAD3HBG1_9STRA|nr:hypothetical protein CTEN210_14123 [Chaetoceros tenuissimus]
MEGNSKKRQRIESKPPWEICKASIEKLGGFISPSIAFSDTTRTVSLSASVKEGDELMRIPSKSLMSLKVVESFPFGKSIFRLVHEVDNGQLFHSKNDLVLALFLAVVQSDGMPDFDQDDRLSCVKCYLGTLPDNSSYDNLPRRWTNEKLEQLLGGTNILERAKMEKNGLLQDFKLLHEAHQKINKEFEKDATFQMPSLEYFDEMIAAVESRAFHCLGDDEVDALVPLLDCINHKRGVGLVSDVSYKRQDDGAIVVNAKIDMDAEYTVGITYGAKGNHQLLIRYGFTLGDNVEPDGSSNDIAEIKVKNKLCEFRRGPKSYTFGCLTKALALCSDDLEDGMGEQDEPTGLDDFLNDCEAEECDFDSMYAEGNDDEGDQNEQEDDEVKNEIVALNTLRTELEKARDGYSLHGDRLQGALNSKHDSDEKFCAILIQSEIKTISFYLDAIEEIVKALSTKSGSNNKDGDLLQKQVLELKDAFLAIRHPEILY